MANAFSLSWISEQVDCFEAKSVDDCKKRRETICYLNNYMCWISLNWTDKVAPRQNISLFIIHPDAQIPEQSSEKTVIIPASSPASLL